MNRTINEKKALKIITLSFPLNFISLFLMLLGLREEFIIIYALGIGGYAFTLMLLYYGAYSLGWEYKRISLEDDALVSGEEQ